MGRRFRLCPLPREFLTEPVEQTVRVRTESRLEVVQRRLHRSRPAISLVAGDQEVTDLVEQAQGPDLAGLDRRGAGDPGDVHPVGQASNAGRVGHDEVAADPDQRAAQGVPLTRLAADVEVTGLGHRRSMA